MKTVFEKLLIMNKGRNKRMSRLIKEEIGVSINQWRTDMRTIAEECSKSLSLRQGQVFVVGCSTSEVIGEKIGTSGTLEVASIIFDELAAFAKQKQIHLAFQSCEHLNRALVVDRTIALERGWEEVAVIPIKAAGGSMATYAYEKMKDPVVVEFIQADAGIDIGDTFIGMHLKHVAVPVRLHQRNMGEAHVTVAGTRPKLIGGERAVYKR